MITICENSDFEIMEIKKILKNQNIEVFEFQNYSLNKNPSTVSAGGNFSTHLKVKKNDYLKAQNILKNHFTKKRIDIVQHLEQIKQLDYLIRSKNTGNLSILSQHIKTSKRQILFKLDFLKSMNAKIKFCKKLNSFYYSEPFELLFQFSFLSITNEDTAEIYCSSEDNTTINFKKISDII